MAHQVQDPVCGMTVDPEKAAGTSSYQGETYYFCGVGCKKEFDRNPENFVSTKPGGNPPDHH